MDDEHRSGNADVSWLIGREGCGPCWRLQPVGFDEGVEGIGAEGLEHFAVASGVDDGEQLLPLVRQDVVKVERRICRLEPSGDHKEIAPVGRRGE